MLNGPVKDNRWIGLYGDIASGEESYDQWVALETAIYLLEHRNDIIGAVTLAEGILDWVKKTLVIDYGFHPAVPGLVEQSTFRVVLTHHQLRLAETYAKLYEATRKPLYKRAAIETANSVTWCLMSDGKMRQGFWGYAAACPLVVSFNDQFCRIMTCIPETAPKGENHLLRYSSYVKTISYGPDSITYESVGPSEDVLTVRSQPREVLAGSRPLPQLQQWGHNEQGWSYDPDTGFLRLYHRAPDVKIQF
jgi:hypothetical protein